MIPETAVDGCQAIARGFAAWLIILGSALPARAEPVPLRFAVFPHLPARVTAETYQPLADYLGESLGRPVDLESAPDPATFHARTAAGEYDLELAPSHFALLAWKESGHRPILAGQEPARGFVVARADGPIRKLADLRGKSLSIPDRSPIVIMRMEKILAGAGLRFGHELGVREAGSHANAALHVSEGLSDAAIVGVFPFRRLPAEVRSSLRIVAETPSLPSLVFLVPARTNPLQGQKIRHAVEQFMRTRAGRVFLQKTGLGGVRPLKPNELNQVEGDASELKLRFRVRQASAGKAK